jgi:E3 ubiquitin-protein ligase HERC2
MSCEDEDEFTLDHENHVSIFNPEHDRQLLAWLHRRPEDWTLSWGGAGTIYGWGHNHRGQLGGVDGAKVKMPTPCDLLSALRPVQLVGGEQTLFAITADGKVHATGYGAGGRLGIGGTDSVCQPNLLESIQHVFIKQVSLIICLEKVVVSRCHTNKYLIYISKNPTIGRCQFRRKTLPRSLVGRRGL